VRLELKTMLSWLRSIRQTLPRLQLPDTGVTLVLGNMACDLDSGVSSIVMAYHRSTTIPNRTVIPVLNIPSQDFPLKTELVAALQDVGVGGDHLVYRDDIDLKSINDLQLILVDHNVLAGDDLKYQDKVVEIIDHHEIETELPSAIIEKVGSCASLVLREILKENTIFAEKECFLLVLQTILIDTVNLDPEAKKVTEEDIKIVKRCEETLGVVDKTSMFTKLSEAKTKVDHLNAKQLLRRDFKTIEKNGNKICLSSVPMLARNWSKLANLDSHIKLFCTEEDFKVVVVLGSSFSSTKKERDIILIGDKECKFYQTVKTALESTSEPCLELTPNTELSNLTGYFQGNVGASRKQILPIIKKAVV